MTEYEFEDLLTGIGSNTTELTALFISIFVANLVCAYAVGKKLDRFQLVVVTFTYSIFQLFVIFLIYGNLMRLNRIVASYTEIENASISEIFLLGPGLLVLAWIISVIFMAQTRKPDSSKARDTDVA